MRHIGSESAIYVHRNKFSWVVPRPVSPQLSAQGLRFAQLGLLSKQRAPDLSFSYHCLPRDWDRSFLGHHPDIHAHPSLCRLVPPEVMLSGQFLG